MSLRILCLAATFALTAFAQLKPADYGKWETLGQATLSPDGRWLAHEIRRTDKSDELRVGPASGGKTTALAFCSAVAFSADSRWLACETTVSESDQDKLKKAKKPLQNKLTVLELATGKSTLIDDVQSFAFSGDAAYLAFRRYPPTRPDAATPAARDADPIGAALTVRDLASGSDTTLGNVTAYAWQDNGSNLAVAIGVEGRAGNALQLLNPKTTVLRVLDSGPALFTNLAWRKDSADLAALRSIKEDGYEGESHAVLAWPALGDKRTTHVDPPRRLVGSRTPQWSEEGAIIYVGIAEWQKKPAGNKSDEDPATVEVWHWKDENVISEQKLNTARDRDRNMTAAWHIAANKLTPLTSNVKEQTRLARHSTNALALDGVPYQNDAMFGRNFTDVFKVDQLTGARSLLAKHLTPPVDFSPGGRYALNFQDGHFHVYNLETGAGSDISKAAPTKFINLENDYPVAQKPAYGIAGWTKNDRSVIVYDAYDLWELFPDGGSAPRRLTDGSAEEIRHRYVRMTPGGARGGRGGRGAGEEADWIDLDKPVYLSLEGRWTKRTGYARLANGKAERLVLLDQGVRGLEKARNAETFVYQAGAWNQSPNFYTATADLKNPAKASDTNPFAAQVRWGKSELIDFKNSHGEHLQGALYYPANYQAGKQYPMIVQIYEIMSTQLHNWTAPSERATYNAAVWTQNGYFVYRPDIVFKPRAPGLSALDCVTSGVKKVLESGMIDAKRIGLVGHSWGGYETTFLLTQTNMFAAGVAGGSLTNLASSYGEIYWNTGSPETSHVEVSQERMEVPLYEDVQAYIRNSAVYFANKLSAPLLLSVGDKDGASDWHQDIELYNSARRAGKPVVMLVYEGENHAVAQKANQLDYHRRINAWFDHYLKGDVAPTWITQGVSILDRERELKKGEKEKPAAKDPGAAN